jgi:hypothetical protein
MAGYCARLGAQTGTVKATDISAAKAVAEQCVSEHGLTGPVTGFDATLTVSLTSTYRTKLLSIIFIDELPVRGVASVIVLEDN